MNPFDLLTPAIRLAYHGLTGLAAVLTPVAGSARGALALVLLTMIIRLAILLLSIRMIRADRLRRSLAPELDRLRRQHSEDPSRLLEETRRMFARPVAACSPVSARPWRRHRS